MEVDRKTVYELAAAALIVVGFTGAVFVVSRSYAASGNTSTNSSVPPVVDPAGGLALVATIAGFVLAVAAIGLFMYSRDFDDDE